MLTCTNDRYTPTADTFATVDDFRAMCRAAFGEDPALTHEPGNGRWVDERGDVVLVEDAEPAVSPAMLSDEFGFTVVIEHTDEGWCVIGVDEDDMFGSGPTLADAVQDARQQVEEWRSMGALGND